MDHVHTRSTSETDVKWDIKISYLNCNSYCITGNWAGLSKSQYWSFKWYLQWFGQFWLYDNANTLTMAVFALEDEQIVWTDKWSGICPSDVNLCCTVVDLFVSTTKLSSKNRLSRRPNIRWFAPRKICSSRLHMRRYVHLDDSFTL